MSAGRPTCYVRSARYHSPGSAHYQPCLSYRIVNVHWAVWGAIAGLPLGWALRPMVFRLSVQAGEPDRTACPACGAGVSAWRAAWRGECGHLIGIPLTLECCTAIVLAALFGRFGGQPELLAFSFLGCVGVALAAIDLAVHRLPDRLTLSALPVLVALLAVAAFLQHDLPGLARAALGGLVLSGCFLLLALIRPGQLGGGDVKLAALVGLALGWLSWRTLLTGAALGFVLAALVSLVLLAARRITVKSYVAFGPFLLGGSLLAMLGGRL
jgi:leader peptidase (prepilin peptidase) / N-methyltransferase